MIIIQGQIWIYVSNFVIKISIKSVINMGIPFYNKVPINVKKLEEYMTKIFWVSMMNKLFYGC